MSDFKSRLTQEQSELQEKLEKLNSFIVSENYKELGSEAQDLLFIQSSSMATYNAVLQRRIKVLND